MVCFGRGGGIWVLSKLVVVASGISNWRGWEEEALTVGVGRVSALSEGGKIEEGGKEEGEEVRFWCLTVFQSRGGEGAEEEGRHSKVASDDAPCAPGPCSMQFLSTWS